MNLMAPSTRFGIITQVSEFTPMSLGPALWLDATDVSTLFDAVSGGSPTANLGVVRRWEDKSGNARHATIADAAQTRLDAVINGLSVIEMASSAFDLPNFLSGSAATWYWAARKSADPPTLADSGATISLAGSSGNGSHEPYEDGIVYSDFGSTVRKTVGDPSISLSTWNYGKIKTAAGAWSWSVRDTVVFSTATNTVGWSVIPKIGGNGGFKYRGQFAEFILVLRATTTDEDTAVADYFKAKYDLGEKEFAWHYDLSDPNAKLNGGVPQLTDNGAMTSILDKSGNGVTLTQNIAGSFVNRNAIYKSATLGCVKFQGTFLGAAINSGWTWPAGVKEFGIVYVVQELVAFNYNGIVLVGASGSGNDYDNTPPRIEFDTSFPGQQNQGSIGGGSGGILYLPAYAGAKLQHDVWSYWQSLTTWEVRKNGVVVQTGSKDFSVFPDRVNGLAFGNRWTGGGIGTNPFNGNMCEMFMVPRATTTPQRDAYDAAMVAKWK